MPAFSGLFDGLLGGNTFPVRRHLRTRGLGRRFKPALLALDQGALVFIRKHLHEFQALDAPGVQQFTGALAAGPAVVLLQQALELRFIGFAGVPVGLVMGLLLGSRHDPVH